MKPRFSFFVLGLLASVSCASPDAPDERTGRQTNPIVEGEEDDEHTSVVAIFVNPGDAFPDGQVCTGALIAPNLVLTARHCVSALAPTSPLACEDSEAGKAQRAMAPVAAKEIGIVSTTNAYDNTNRPQKPKPASRVVILPDSTKEINCGRDIALIELTTPATTPAHEPRLDGPPAIGDTFSAVGYGTVDGKTGDGIRRSGSGFKVVHVGEQKEAGLIHEAENEWLADKGPCRGDSGGPAFDENGKIIGIVSRGGASCSNMVFTRVDVYGDWIRASVREASERAGIETPAWAIDTSAVADAGADASEPEQSVSPKNDAAGCSIGTRAAIGGGWRAFLVAAVVAGFIARILGSSRRHS